MADHIIHMVAAAAAGLTEVGREPTIMAMREWMGTGSPNTVYRHLTAWRATRPQPAALTPEQLPAGIVREVLQEIECAAAEARAEIEGQLAQAQRDAAELSLAGEALKTEREDLLKQIAALTTERDQAQIIERERIPADTARVELATAKLKIEAQAEKLEAQKTEIKWLRSAFEAEQQARRQADQASSVASALLESEREARKLEARTSAERLSSAEAREAAAVARIAEIEARAQDREQQMNARLAEVEARERMAQADFGECRVNALVLKTRLETAGREIEECKREIGELRESAQEAEREAAELRGQLIAIQEEKERQQPPAEG